MSRGFLISFEGVDGAGKSTQIRLLRARLEGLGWAVAATREPGGDALGESIRALLLDNPMCARTELLLFLAARANHVSTTIRPLLETGRVVLTDRFIDSSVAYQGYARGLGPERVEELNCFATGGLEPDLTLLLDVSADRALQRQRHGNRMEAEGLEFQERVRRGFQALAEKNPERFRVVDAGLPTADVHEAVRHEVEKSLHCRLAAGLLSAPQPDTETR